MVEISDTEMRDLVSVIHDQQEVIRLLIEKIRVGEGLDDETYHQMIAHVNKADKAVARTMRAIPHPPEPGADD